MQNFGGTNKEYYGILESGPRWILAVLQTRRFGVKQVKGQISTVKTKNKLFHSSVQFTSFLTEHFDFITNFSLFYILLEKITKRFFSFNSEIICTRGFFKRLKLQF